MLRCDEETLIPLLESLNIKDITRWKRKNIWLIIIIGKEA